MLPGVDGLTVCQRLRDDANVTTPIIMLTARDQLSDKLKGFESGADDYLIKPFDMPELEARLEAVIRRSQHLEKEYHVSGLTLNLDTMEVVRDEQPLTLSRTLFNILHVLIRESPKVVTRAALERELWGDEPPDSDTLRSHIYNLRRIIDRPFDEPLLQTRQGQGYCLRKASAE
jgi:DNA-binding response OmpR family regulator